MSRGGRRAALSSSREPGGWWVGELESNVTMTAQHLFLLEFLGLRDEDTTRRLRRTSCSPGSVRTGSGRSTGTASPTWPRRSRRTPRFAWRGSRARRRAARGGAALLRGARRDRRGAGLHAHLARALRAVALGRDPAASARAGAAAALDARSPSTTSPAGRARPSSRSPSSCTTGRSAALPPERACHELEPRAGRPRKTHGWASSATGCLRWYAGQPFQPGRERALAIRGALDHRPSGARRLVGRHPAAVGLVADRARLPRPRARVSLPQPRARRAGSASWSRTATGSGPRRASRRSGTPASRSSALRAADVPADDPALRQGRRVDASPRRSGSAATGPSGARGRAGRLGVRVRQRPLPGRRRRRGRRARARGARDGRAAPSSGPAAGWPAMQSSRTAAGAPSTSTTTPYWLYEIPFCDFGAVIDPPSVDVTAHVVELLAREAGLRGGRARAASSTCSAKQERGRLVVRALGRQLRLRHRRRAARARGRRRSARRTRRSAVPSPGSWRARTRTAASARTAARTTAARPGLPGAGAACRRRRRPPGR